MRSQVPWHEPLLTNSSYWGLLEPGGCQVAVRVSVYARSACLPDHQHMATPYKGSVFMSLLQGQSQLNARHKHNGPHSCLLLPGYPATSPPHLQSLWRCLRVGTRAESVHQGCSSPGLCVTVVEGMISITGDGCLLGLQVELSWRSYPGYQWIVRRRRCKTGTCGPMDAASHGWLSHPLVLSLDRYLPSHPPRPLSPPSHPCLPSNRLSSPGSSI
jgi:hypothetical protein